MSLMSRMQSGNQKQWQADINAALPIIDDRLYFTMTKSPRNTDKIHMFSIDHALRYEPFFVDFGPLNLACVYKFCKLMEHKLEDNKYKNCKIYYYCDRTPQRLSNAAFLIGAYQIIELHRNPQEAYRRIKPFADKGVPFRDASMGLCTYIGCNVKHCLYAIDNGMKWNYINFKSFKVDEYEHYERVECGDLNIIIPDKFIAFAGPYFKEFDEEGYPALTPDFYIPIWRKFKVSAVIRLNKKCYDKRIFTKAGFEHHDLYFIDGTTPTDSIINKFIEICENASGVLAVHCKAGLGRTGSLIGCYMMKHYSWSAAQCICWMRICRPGSVIGPQQQFLEQQQAKMWRLGDLYRKKYSVKIKYDQRIKKSPSPKKNKNKNKNEHKSSNSTSTSYYHCNDDHKNDKPLATDPGQNQGAALKHAKASSQQHPHPHHETSSHSNSNSKSNSNPYARYNLNNNSNNGNSSKKI